jgi:hypothetical protein
LMATPSAVPNDRHPWDCTGDGAGEGDGRVARPGLVADATVVVIANPMSGRDIRRPAENGSTGMLSRLVTAVPRNSRGDNLVRRF